YTRTWLAVKFGPCVERLRSPELQQWGNVNIETVPGGIGGAAAPPKGLLISGSKVRVLDDPSSRVVVGQGRGGRPYRERCRVSTLAQRARPPPARSRTSRTFVASAWAVNGFCRNSVSRSRTP